MITTTNRQQAEAAYQADPSDANLSALKAASEAEMDAYLSGFDARHANDTHTNIRSLTPARQREIRIASRILVPSAPRPALSPLRAAYNRYIDDGLSATDGYFAPLSFEQWKDSMTTVLEPTPEYRTLTPQAKRRDSRTSEPRRNQKRPYRRG